VEYSSAAIELMTNSSFRSQPIFSRRLAGLLGCGDVRVGTITLNDGIEVAPLSIRVDHSTACGEPRSHRDAHLE
jgi:hypothetical protein